MKKMLVVSFLLAAGLSVGCSKKNPQTTPTGTQTEMKQDGSEMGGARYGAPATPDASDATADPCAAPN